jgi:hypothetical protein
MEFRHTGLIRGNGLLAGHKAIASKVCLQLIRTTLSFTALLQLPPPSLRDTSPEFRGGKQRAFFDSLLEFGEGWGGVKWGQSA